MPKSAEKYLARLKPYNERKGHVVRQYMYKGNRFYVDRGWYEIDAALASELRDLRQVHEDPDSADLFDIVTQAEAERIEQEEADRAAAARATAARPAALTNVRNPKHVVPRDDDDESGDLQASEVRREPPKMIDPAEDDDDLDGEDEGRALEVGRVIDPDEVEDVEDEDADETDTVVETPSVRPHVTSSHAQHANTAHKARERTATTARSKQVTKPLKPEPRQRTRAKR